MPFAKPFVFTRAVLLGVAVAAPFQASAQVPAPVASTAKPDFAATAKADVVRSEQELAKTNARFQQSQTSKTELSEAKIRLADARLQLAQIENQPETIIQQARVIVDERTQILSYVDTANKVGAASLSELNAARLALAEARVNLELYSLIGIKRENAALALRLYEAGVVSKDEINQAAQPAALGRIQTLLSTEIGSSKKQDQQHQGVG